MDAPFDIFEPGTRDSTSDSSFLSASSPAMSACPSPATHVSTELSGTTTSTLLAAQNSAADSFFSLCDSLVSKATSTTPSAPTQTEPKSKPDSTPPTLPAQESSAGGCLTPDEVASILDPTRDEFFTLELDKLDELDEELSTSATTTECPLTGDSGFGPVIPPPGLSLDLILDQYERKDYYPAMDIWDLMDKYARFSKIMKQVEDGHKQKLTWVEYKVAVWIMRISHEAKLYGVDVFNNKKDLNSAFPPTVIIAMNGTDDCIYVDLQSSPKNHSETDLQDTIEGWRDTVDGRGQAYGAFASGKDGSKYTEHEDTNGIDNNDYRDYFLAAPRETVYHSTGVQTRLIRTYDVYEKVYGKNLTSDEMNIITRSIGQPDYVNPSQFEYGKPFLVFNEHPRDEQTETHDSGFQTMDFAVCETSILKTRAFASVTAKKLNDLCLKRDNGMRVLLEPSKDRVVHSAHYSTCPKVDRDGTVECASSFTPVIHNVVYEDIKEMKAPTSTTSLASSSSNKLSKIPSYYRSSSPEPNARLTSGDFLGVWDGTRHPVDDKDSAYSEDTLLDFSVSDPKLGYKAIAEHLRTPTPKQTRAPNAHDSSQKQNMRGLSQKETAPTSIHTHSSKSEQKPRAPTQAQKPRDPAQTKKPCAPVQAKKSRDQPPMQKPRAQPQAEKTSAIPQSAHTTTPVQSSPTSSQNLQTPAKEGGAGNKKKRSRDDADDEGYETISPASSNRRQKKEAYDATPCQKPKQAESTGTTNSPVDGKKQEDSNVTPCQKTKHDESTTTSLGEGKKHEDNKRKHDGSTAEEQPKKRIRLPPVEQTLSVYIPPNAKGSAPVKPKKIVPVSRKSLQSKPAGSGISRSGIMQHKPQLVRQAPPPAREAYQPVAQVPQPARETHQPARQDPQSAHQDLQHVHQGLQPVYQGFSPARQTVQVSSIAASKRVDRKPTADRPEVKKGWLPYNSADRHKGRN